jgi:thioredoxin 1
MGFIIVKDESHFRELITTHDSSTELIVCYFTATWCGPCKQIFPVVSNIGNNNDHILVLKIDVDDCEDVSEMCEISCMPTFKFYKNNSLIPVHSFSGADNDELVNSIKLLLKTNNVSREQVPQEQVPQEQVPREQVPQEQVPIGYSNNGFDLNNGCMLDEQFGTLNNDIKEF